jgi:two-component system, NtrC family, response regulator AtoC
MSRPDRQPPLAASREYAGRGVAGRRRSALEGYRMPTMDRPTRILVVDDEPAVARVISSMAESLGHGVDIAESVETAIERSADTRYDVVLTDLQMGPASGIDLVRRLQQNAPRVPVVVITGWATIESAMEAIQAGAYDYLSKPLRRDALQALLDRAIEEKRLVERGGLETSRLRSKVSLADIAGKSPAMLEVFKTVARVAPGRSNVLILGESGTGKELVARALHHQSSRANQRFVPVNLTAIPDGLLESELFGHVLGAFTGATGTRRGLFEEAHQGTLFLDEIGDLSLPLQAKLLRVIQEQKIKRVGGNEEIDVDVRLVVATHRNLDQMVREGTFREDLYYRLNVVSLSLPPLRERREDIPVLVEHFLQKYELETGQSVPRFADDALVRILHYDWPGNVRELENAIERAVLLSGRGTITPDVLPPRLLQGPMPEQAPGAWVPLDTMIERYVEQVLEHTGGNRSRAAQILGISRRTLQRMAERKRIESRRASGSEPASN